MNDAALEALYAAYAPTLYGLILRIVKDESLAEEVLTGCFTNLKMHSSQVRGERGSLLSWLVQNARQVALECMHTKEFRYRLLANELYRCKLYLGDVVPTDVYGQVRNAVTPLPEEAKMVLDLLYFEGLSVEKVAHLLNLPPQQVKNRLLEAVRLLKNAAKDEPSCLA